MMTSRTTTVSASKAPSASRATPRRRLLRLALVLGTALSPVGALADSLPTGGSVVHGTATISTPNATTMTINQGSDRAVVNWDGFSIGAGSRVDIHQPDANAAILNRVTGDTTSQIHGQLNANGRVFVVNPNGIFIGPTGTVNAGGFVASTLGIRTDDFVTGKTVFEGDGASATVSNAGNIEVVTGGYAALIGGKVRNSGTIQAPLGFVGLGSGERVTLDLAGDGFLQVAVPTDTGDDGLEALIENSGSIQANGGTVQISAATARNAARHAINMSGVVEARSVSGRNGRVTLGGGAGGKVTVGGTVRTATRPTIQVTQSVRPALRPDRGGDITITGRDITLTGAEIDASGTEGGGSIRIGGEYKGGAGLPTADTLTVDQTSTIRADAVTTGDGGRVILWSDLDTKFAGNISIRGGDLGGNGGFAEVSGKVDLTYRGFTDGRAPNGKAGELLLDPANIEIVASAPAFNQIRDTDLETQLAGVSVTIATSGPDLPTTLQFPDSTLGFGEQPGDEGTITVTALASVEWSSGNTLQLNADQDIIVNGDLIANGGGLGLNAAFGADGGRIVVNGTVSADNGFFTFDADEDITIAGSGTLRATDSNVSLNAADIEIDGTFIVPGAMGFTSMSASNGVNITNANPFDATFGNVSINAFDITLDRQADVADGSITMTADNSLTIGTAGSIVGSNAATRLTSDGPININGPILTPDGRLILRALGTDPITPGTGGEINTGLFQLSAGDWVQNGLGGGIAPFSATNFVITNPGTSSFLRVLDGNGADPDRYQLTDVYGLQGVGTVAGGSAFFELANDIEAGSTTGWIALDAAVNGESDGGFVPLTFNGNLNGNRYTVRDLFSRRHGATSGLGRAGLFSTIGSTGFVSQLNLANVDLSGTVVGGIAAINDGIIFGTSVTGQIQVFNELGASTFGGGIAGRNGTELGAGGIGASWTDVTITDIDDPSQGSGAGLSNAHSIGGIAGQNRRTIIGTRSSGSISYDNAIIGFVGGIAGDNSDDVSDSYSDAQVAANTTGGTEAHIGSITGRNTGEIARVIATGPVSVVGGVGTGGGIGAVTGTDGPSNISLISSFFSVSGTGQNVSGQNGENTGIGPGIDTYFEGAVPDEEVVPGEEFVALDDAVPFTILASIGGNWNFNTVWSYPDDGVDQARLYSIDPVISARDDASPTPEVEYAGTGLNFSAVMPVYGGGPLLYVFGPLGDTGVLTVMDDQLVLSSTNAGSRTYRFPSSYTSDLGQVFSVRSFPQPLTITPRLLTINIDDASKVEGTEILFNGTEFAATGLVANDAVNSLTITSDGAPASAPISGSPYAINGASPVGFGLGNYSITINPGVLTISPAPIPEEPEEPQPEDRFLDIFLSNLTKTYGETLTFTGTEFTTAGLAEGDTVDSLTITSEGAAPGAQVSETPYDIIGTDPVGTGLGNYVINIVPGRLTIVPAPLTVTANNQNKPFGTEFVFEGNEFTVTGLFNDDTVESATLTSAAAAADAPFTGEDGAAIVITDPTGVGLDNYTVQLVNGVMIIAPGNLTIRANDQSKVYGTAFTFDGTEFTVTGLAEGDSVDSVTLTSAGADATAQVADGPFVITASDAVGTGLDKYTLIFADGSFTVVPAPLTVTANDQTKQQGQLFTFAGTEFTTSGLLNGDSVDTAVLTSAGAAAEALADDSPFAINLGTLTGTGLSNYEISTVSGSFEVQNLIVPPVINPVPPGNLTVTNPPDSINIGFPGDTGIGGLGGPQERGGTGGPTQSLPQARETNDAVDTISTELELQVQSCGSADQDFTNYMACLSESLDTYANALDQIANDLPSGLENVSAIIRTASDEVNAATARAQTRLAGATSDAERRAIQRDAVNEARGAIETAKSEIRKAIALIRADDPEVTAVQRDTGARIIQAFDTVDSALVRAVEL